ncbi:hypothetical protein L484_020577 [Morus notabilis]|uniref:Uncharacterized protein n=1 Tax=Morus notabilis TaxID=981085 RepID=W9S8U6_9ROSA|nr:hypothetical protein L484_020577 [Morus notabilis]
MPRSSGSSPNRFTLLRVCRLVCQTTINVARYRAVIFHINDRSIIHNEGLFVYKAATFSSETGQWNVSTFLLAAKGCCLEIL